MADILQMTSASQVKCILSSDNVLFPNKILLRYVPKDNKSALVQLMNKWQIITWKLKH